MANQRTDSTKGGTVKVTLKVSPVGFDRKQLTVVRSLGEYRLARRRGQTILSFDTARPDRCRPQLSVFRSIR